MRQLKEAKHSEELEQNVLSILIFGGGHYTRSIDFLNPSDFYKTIYMKMFQAIQRMQSKDISINPVNFTLETGSEFANEIADLGPMYVSDVLLEEYAESLKKMAVDRKLDQAYLAEDKQTLLSLLTKTPQLRFNPFFDFADVRIKTKHYLDAGDDHSVSTGWSVLDDYFKIAMGQLSVVTGIPNSGKSNWMDAVTVNLAREHDYKTVYFSPENLPIQRQIRSIVQKFSHHNFFHLDHETLDLCLDWIYEHYKFINPETINRNIDTILDIIENLNGYQIAVIDPWNELEHLRPNYMSETEYTASVLMKVRALAVRKNMHIFIVAHPTKLKKEKGKYPVPSPYDISGSSHWRNKPDNCLTVWRDFEDDKVRIHVQKIRFQDFGKIGKTELIFVPETGEYTQPSERW
jgi:hypothetical protein